MHVRRYIAATALVGLLAACGGDDDETPELPDDPLEEDDADVEDEPEPIEEEPTEEETEPEEEDLDTEPDNGETSYEVQSGDTLSTIAAEFDTTVEEILEVNDIDDPDLLHVGEELVIP